MVGSSHSLGSNNGRTPISTVPAGGCPELRRGQRRYSTSSQQDGLHIPTGFLGRSSSLLNKGRDQRVSCVQGSEHHPLGRRGPRQTVQESLLHLGEDNIT